VNLILAIPLEVRLALVFLIGLALGSLVNLGAYRLAYQRRLISPWSAPPAGARRRWTDRLPVIGWWGLRREGHLHGRAFWIRPMIVELATGLLLAGLYWWEVGQFGLLAAPLRQAALAARPADPAVVAQVHWQFLAHAMLGAWMLLASLIDADEKTIPDAVTIPGTLAGLLLAAVAPAALLPDMAVTRGPGAAGLPQRELTVVTAASPDPWPATLAPAPNVLSLAVAASCFGIWCFGLLERPWYTRHGLGRAVRILCARLIRQPMLAPVGILAAVGLPAIALAWWHGGPRWQALCSALVGMAAGGGLIWLVRVVASRVLRKEAMGFGDVTLMAMIGAFLGWQACLAVFFLAPFAGLVVGGMQWLVRRDHEIPYGPFLCLAAAVVVVFWAPIWQSIRPIFSPWWLVPAVFLVCVALMAIMLAGLRWMTQDRAKAA
jgi:leader peptidase (prepilin peptidase)/N-methyltransferase